MDGDHVVILFDQFTAVERYEVGVFGSHDHALERVLSFERLLVENAER